MTGERLAHYQIDSLIGAGGMGEVYPGLDTRLGRKVAIKILPEAFATDPDRIARFQREAMVLASFNHPNIAALYGMEHANGRHFLVMELVEGETLADRVQCGPIPIEETLKLALQVTEALETAHEKGVIHRDLKPANIKVTPDGKVKVLDFGLAKAMSGASASATARSHQGMDAFSNSPTLSLAATNAGIIIGTAAYMSPEQARGTEADKRADIWAFGVVLYEMLTGRRLFDEPSTSDALAAVLKSVLKLDALPGATPLALRRLLGRCLDRDRRSRLRDIGEARITIETVLEHPEAETSTDAAHPTTAAPPFWRRALPWAAASVALAIAGVTAWTLWPRPGEPPTVLRLSSELGADAGLLLNQGPAVALSPDGKTLAFVASKDGNEKTQIYVRRLDQLQASILAGTDGARDPFFSPEGQWIAFFADNKLKKISVNGGAAVTLCNVENDRVGTWADDGTIVFAPASRGGLFRVSQTGGTPEPLTKLDSASRELSHRWPQVLPGGRAVMFTASADPGNAAAWEDANIVVQSIPGGERKVVQRGGYSALYLPSGHLVYIHEATLFAVPFDLNRLETAGSPVPVLQGVMTGRNGAQFAFSRAGSIVYVRCATQLVGLLPIYWMNRDGTTQPLRATPAQYSDIRFSPDGKRLAMTVLDTQSDIWVYEWARDTMSRLTFDPAIERDPRWTPDGRRIAFVRRGKAEAIYWQRADGTGEPELLTESDKGFIAPMSWHPNGKFLAFDISRGGRNVDIMILPMNGDESSGWKPGTPATFLATPFNEAQSAFSPDGRWLAYQSDESGRFEVYVRPFPGPGGKWQISSTGGRFPTWSRTGKELFYLAPDQKIMAASYASEGDSFRAEKPRLWSESARGTVDAGVFTRTFDLHPDGQRFAVIKASESTADAKTDKVVFILNFFDELRRIAPLPKR